MSTNCAGRHVCEPEWYPTGVGEQDGSPWLAHVPEGTFGWTTRP